MPHRGNNYYSIIESKVFDNLDDMFNHIVESTNKEYETIKKEDICVDIGKPFSDERLGWAIEYYVCVTRYGDVNYIEKYHCPQCIGYMTIVDDKDLKEVQEKMEQSTITQKYKKGEEK